MPKICVLQTDNRPSLNYLLLTQEINKMCCNALGYDYIFEKINDNVNTHLHPATKKIIVVNDFLQNFTCDILIFLDSDAWIQNIHLLNNLVNNLINDSEKQGCFSRDPYVKKNTYINSGSFIIKNNDFTKEMYGDIINNLQVQHICHNMWPYDQYYISNYIFTNKHNFIIFVPDILNTPIGKVLRHNWCKNNKMYDDLLQLKMNITLNSHENFNQQDYYDNEIFPNLNTTGYEYIN